LRRGALLAFAASLLVAGCGQRGPLYLPENAPPPRRRRTEPQQAPAPTESQR
jgi:predicted small lipoprotein YifL